MKARTLLRWSILSCALLVAALTSASAQNYPNRPVKFILPYAAGGTGDIIVRLLGTKLPGIWGQQLVVDNRTGAGGLIGTEAAARSDPDGYTLYLGTDGPLTVAASLHKRLPYHWKRDFAPVTMMAVSYQVMLVKASNPARDLKDFIANAKQKPGEINYGSIGIGSAPHLTAEIFKAAAGIEATHVPYRGSSAQAMTAMIAGDVQMLMNGTASSIPHIRSGALRALAITAPRRTENLAEIPTFTEFGLPSVDAVLWFAAMVPAGTPQPIIRKLHADLTQVLNDPEIKASLAARGLEVRAEGPEKLAEFLERDYVKFRDLLQKLNLQVE